MEKLQLPHAKLFYFSAELYKNNKISENEKLKLKEMVINDEPQVFELLERYQQNNLETEFVNGLLNLLRPHQKQIVQPPLQPQQAPVQYGLRPTQQNQAPQYTILQQVQQQEQKYSPQEQQQAEYQDSNANNQESLNPKNEEIAQFIEKHPDCPDEISSPLGLKLLKRKQKAQKANPQVKDYLKPYKIDQE